MNPLVQSWAVMRFSIIDATSESETRPPFFMTAASWPSGEPVATSALSMSPVESCGRFVAATSRAACVPLPEAGGPKSMMTRRGSVVALHPVPTSARSTSSNPSVSPDGLDRRATQDIWSEPAPGGPNTSPQISPHESEERAVESTRTHARTPTTPASTRGATSNPQSARPRRLPSRPTPAEQLWTRIRRRRLGCRRKRSMASGISPRWWRRVRMARSRSRRWTRRRRTRSHQT